MSKHPETAMPSLAEAVRVARVAGGVNVPPDRSVNELARQAGLSPSQVSRIENGKLRKPSREILVALGRALDRNPLPLLILAGHLSDPEAQTELRDFFRDGAEAPQEWGDWTRLPLEAVRQVITESKPDPDHLRAIAADLFAIQETVETMWHDSYALIAASSPTGDQLRMFAAVLRELSPEDRDQVLAHACALRDRNDLEFQLGELRMLSADSAEAAR
jgi:transcriptional regulator with XRE-family HTH domain